MLYYALSLLCEFLKIIPDRLSVFCGEHNKDFIHGIHGIARAKNHLISVPGDIFDFRNEFDILFCPAFWGGANMLDFPIVHTIPDIQEQFFPDFFVPIDLESLATYHPYTAKASTLTITISSFSKNTIVNAFNVPENKIRVTHLAAHKIFSSENDVGNKPGNLPEDMGKFFFYPANCWRHKNHVTLLNALSIIKEQEGIEIPTIFTGNLLEGLGNRVDVVEEIQSRGLGKSVFHIGEVNLPELKFLYKNALALVHPSLFEGFGIPVVEAMACGCPIIAADSTSLPEIAGSAGLYFKPNDPQDLANKILVFLNSPSDVARRVEHGRQLAKNFSDSKTALQTLDILYEAYDLNHQNRVFESGFDKSTVSLHRPIVLINLIKNGVSPNNGSYLEELILAYGDNIKILNFLEHAQLGSKKRIGVGDNSINCGFGLSFSKCLEEISANYSTGLAMFCNEDHLPHKPFIGFLLATYTQDNPFDEMLIGDSYLFEEKTQRLRDLYSKPLVGDIELEHHAKTDLAFVVPVSKLAEALSHDSYSIESLADLFETLWNICPRKRVYRIFNLVTTSDMDRRLFLDQFSKESFLNNFTRQPVIKKIMESDAGFWLVSNAIGVYQCKIKKVLNRMKLS
ncbi:MAG: glycosyltransferase family 4 protein [Desulfomonilaceae bacterium]